MGGESRRRHPRGGPAVAPVEQNDGVVARHVEHVVGSEREIGRLRHAGRIVRR